MNCNATPNKNTNYSASQFGIGNLRRYARDGRGRRAGGGAAEREVAPGLEEVAAGRAGPAWAVGEEYGSKLKFNDAPETQLNNLLQSF